MRRKYIYSLVLTLVLALTINPVSAQEITSEQPADSQTQIQEERKENIMEAIDHHLLDSHYFDFFSDSDNGKYYGFALPVILVDNGLKVFSAAEFAHGDQVVAKGDSHYKMYNSKIYKTDAAGTLSFSESGFPTNERPLDLSVTKNVFTIIVTGILMFLMFVGMAKTYRKQQLPKGIGRILEPIIVFIRDDIARPSIGPKYRRYMPLLLTLFFFILILNLLGLSPLGVNVTGNITITLALALVTFFVTQFSGNKHYWGHIFWFPDVHPVVKIILIPIEILGMFTKPFSLMIRLFANMTAGHVMIMSFIGFIFIFKNWIAGPAFFGFTLFIYVLKILVAFLQAYIFTLLSALYIAAAVEVPEDEAVEEDEVPIV